MTRTRLDFGDNASPGTVFLRLINDEPGFLLLHNVTKQKIIVPDLTLHVDFMHAELYPKELGNGARGLGIVEFGQGGPQITDRNTTLGESVSYGFVFDMASPYPIGELPNGIRPQPVGSTFRSTRQAFQQAYQLYTAAVGSQTSIGGMPHPAEPGYQVPVFEVERWRRGENIKNVFGEQGQAAYLPVFKLVGMVNHLAKPLTQIARDKFAEVKTRELIDESAPATPSMLGGLPDESGGIADSTKPIPNRSIRRKLKLPLKADDNE